MSAADAEPSYLDRLLDRLRVTAVPDESSDDDTVFGVERNFRKATVEDGRVFGGQLAAQIVLAAQATVPDDKAVVAFHVDYLVMGQREAPLRYHVEATSSARTEVRRVVARQGHTVAVGTVTFQPAGSGFDHHHRMPDAAPPDGLDPHWRMDGRGFRVRSEDGHDPFDPAAADDNLRLWWSTDGPMPDEPALHSAVLTYVSDLTMTFGPFRPLEGYTAEMMDKVVSMTVNYSMWFHRPFRVDDWLLHVQATPSAAAGRGLTVSHWFTADGTLVASAAQQTASRIR